MDVAGRVGAWVFARYEDGLVVSGMLASLGVGLFFLPGMLAVRLCGERMGRVLWMPCLLVGLPLFLVAGMWMAYVSERARLREFQEAHGRAMANLPPWDRWIERVCLGSSPLDRHAQWLAQQSGRTWTR